MKSKYLTLVLAAIMVLSIQSCSKYDEGPGLSFRSKKARLSGTWKQTKESVNGKDQPLDADDKDDEMIIKKDGSFEMIDPGKSTTTGTWSFQSDDKVIKFVFGSGQVSFTQEMNIIRLANKELILERMDGSDKTRIEFEQ